MNLKLDVPGEIVRFCRLECVVFAIVVSRIGVTGIVAAEDVVVMEGMILRMGTEIEDADACREFAASVVVELAAMGDVMMDRGKFVFVGIVEIVMVFGRIEVGGVGDAGKFVGAENGEFADVRRCGD